MFNNLRALIGCNKKKTLSLESKKFSSQDNQEKTIMRLNASHPILPANREEKEAKLKDFVLSDLAGSRDGTASSPPAFYTVIARAPDSPVVRVLHALANDIAAAGIEIRAILFETEPSFEEAIPALSLLDISEIDARVLNDARFAAAHEQLVLSPGRIWIGDCMRRDPTKRDAFEMYADSDATAFRHAESSFARVWPHAKPLKTVRGSAGLAHDAVLASQSQSASDGRPVSRR